MYEKERMEVLEDVEDGLESRLSGEYDNIVCIPEFDSLGLFFCVPWSTQRRYRSGSSKRVT
jgi:hypothetical protein